MLRKTVIKISICSVVLVWLVLSGELGILVPVVTSYNFVRNVRLGNPITNLSSKSTK